MRNKKNRFKVLKELVRSLACEHEFVTFVTMDDDLHDKKICMHCSKFVFKKKKPFSSKTEVSAIGYDDKVLEEKGTALTIKT